MILKKKIGKYLKQTIGIIVNTFRIRSIQSIITLSFTLITILTMIFIGVTLYNKFSKTAEKNVIISTNQIIDQVSLNLEYYIMNMAEVSNLITENLNTISDINMENLKGVFDVTLKIRKDIVTLAIFSKDGELIKNTDNFKLKKGLNIKEQEWFKKVDKPGGFYFSSPHVQNLFSSKHMWVVSLSEAVKMNYENKSIDVVSLVDMNFSVIDRLCQRVSLGKRGYIYVIDKDGNIIYHPQQQMIYIGLKTENIDDVTKRNDGSYVENYDGEKRLLTIKTVSYTGWRIIGVSYMDEIVTTSKEIYDFMTFILIFGVIFVFSISLFISAKISLPIKRLEKLMKKVEKGQFDIYAEVKGEDEVKQLSRTFNLMILRIRELMDQIVKEQELKRKSELKALQAQINPHFLYNTLDSIVWMAENDKNQGVITMVTSLAKLFRISISKGEETASIKDELEHARNYLIIQQIRFKDKFDFVFEIQPEVYKYRTVKLVLQPIIENAIYHGIGHIVDKGMIQIKASIIQDKILFEIIDNGAGMTSRVLERVLRAEAKSETGSGVGVKNVNERIQIYFGKEYGLEIQSELDAGTCVKIWIKKYDEAEGE